MKSQQTTTFITAKSGNVFALPDKSMIFSSIIYLSPLDSADNYIEISISEAEEIIKAQQDAAEKSR